MKKYTAINIGPIIDTFSMAKKPRELWNASYMFSYLMKCIIKNLSNYKIITPATIDWSKPIFNEVGLYPDRIFIEGEIDTKEVINNALADFQSKTGVGNDYVNIMSVTIEYDEATGVIKELNRLLDCLELYKRPISDKGLENVSSLLFGSNKMKLYEYATSKSQFSIPSLSEIATHNLKKIDICNWLKACEKLKSKSEREEDKFYQEIKKLFKNEYKSYYKYICIVQADGDNMGEIVSALNTNKVKSLSESLLHFGSDACKIIKSCGGLPIYAGGDDLLFIVPIVTSIDIESSNSVLESYQNNKTTIIDLLSRTIKAESNETCLKTQINIFDLLSAIDMLYKNVDNNVKNLEGSLDLHTSMSYGLSISYYKYPLYESLKSAREQLFDKAKKIQGKNAVAWCLHKNSGSGFIGSFSKNSNIHILFSKLQKTNVDIATISAVAHKLRENQSLLDIIRNKDESRLKAFYKNFIEENPLDNNSYKGLTRMLLWELFQHNTSKRETKDILETLYGMLRTAKFINGENDYDE